MEQQDNFVTFAETDCKSMLMTNHPLKDDWQDITTAINVSFRADTGAGCLLRLLQAYSVMKYSVGAQSISKMYVVPCEVDIDQHRERISVCILQEAAANSKQEPFLFAISNLIDTIEARGMEYSTAGLTDVMLTEYQLSGNTHQFPNSIILAGPVHELYRVLIEALRKNLIQQVDRNTAPTGWVGLRVEHPSVQAFERLLKTQFRVVYVLHRDACIVTGTIRGVMAALNASETDCMRMPRRRTVHMIQST